MSPVIEILQLCYLENLEQLNLGTVVEDYDLKDLKNCFFIKLQTLVLKSSNITNKAILNLQNCYFPELKDLNLDNSKINDTGIKMLIKCNFPKLSRISLESTQVTNESINILQNSNFFKLSILNLKDSKVDKKNSKILKIFVKEIKKVTPVIKDTNSTGVEKISNNIIKVEGVKLHTDAKVTSVNKETNLKSKETKPNLKKK